MPQTKEMTYILVNNLVFCQQIRVFSQKLFHLNSRKLFVSKQCFSQTFYQILGINENCNKKSIRLAYLKLCKQFHPDMNRHINDPKLTECNKVKFQEINRAYNCLIKDQDRQVYDQSLRQRNRPRNGHYSGYYHNNRQMYNTSKNYHNYYYNRNFNETPFEFDSRNHRMRYPRKNHGIDRNIANAFIISWLCLVIFATIFESVLDTIDINHMKNEIQYKQIKDETKNSTKEDNIEKFMRKIN